MTVDKVDLHLTPEAAPAYDINYSIDYFFYIFLYVSLSFSKL